MTSGKMTRERKRPSAASLLLSLLAAFAADAAFAAGPGEITHLSGAVIARRADGQSRILSVRSDVQEGDLLATTENSYARIKWNDGGEVVLRPNTQLKIDVYKYEESRPQADNVVMSLIKGGLRSVTGLLGRRNPSVFRMVTPSATIGIRGTHFGALLCTEKRDCENIPSPTGRGLAEGLYVDVSDGEVFVSNERGTLALRVGEFGFVASSLVPPVNIPSGEGVKVPLPSAALNRLIQGGTVGKSTDLECAI